MPHRFKADPTLFLINPPNHSPFSSVYGALLVSVGTIFLLYRIRIEERMLIEAFAEDYKEYQRKTKRIIPYIY